MLHYIQGESPHQYFFMNHVKPLWIISKKLKKKLITNDMSKPSQERKLFFLWLPVALLLAFISAGIHFLSRPYYDLSGLKL